MERLVEVWMDERMVERLRGGIRCSKVTLGERRDGTCTLALTVSYGEARCWDWPVETGFGDGESLVRESLKEVLGG